ncbi:MAG: Gfo/Idh/MocA family oxidoreductase, partial [Ilumatobacter sp.]
MSQLGVGVIGAGMMGEVHAHLIAERIGSARVVAVSDPDGDRRRRVAESVGAAEVSDPLDVITDPEVQAVIIASPDQSHAEYAIASVQANKPCLCEKPLATTADDARAVVEAESAGGRRLVQVGFMREFDEGHASLVTLRDSGALGEVVAVRSTHINPAPWAPGVSAERVITQSMIHDIHSARFLVGSEVIAVSAVSVPFGAGAE